MKAIKRNGQFIKIVANKLYYRRKALNHGWNVVSVGDDYMCMRRKDGVPPLNFLKGAVK